MSDKITGLYKAGVSVFLRVAIFILAAGLLIFAVWVGFSASFQKCFGQQCSETSGSLIFILPGIVLFGLAIGWLKWRHHRKAKYRASVRDELVSEGVVEAQTPKQRVLSIIRANGSLTIPELIDLTKIEHDDLLLILQQLLQAKSVSQSAKNGVTTFSSISKS